MSHPAAMLGGVAAGIAVGLGRADLAAALAPVGQLYVTLLNVLVLPFMVSAIVVSLARLWSRWSAGTEIGRLVGAILLWMVIAAAVGVGTGQLLAPGELPPAAEVALGQMVDTATNAFAADAKVSLTAPRAGPDRIQKMSETLAHVVPDNIFHALSRGHRLQVVIFSVLFGLALGATSRGRGNAMIEMMEVGFHSCQTMMRGANTLLPIAMCVTVAPLVGRFTSGANAGALQAMALFVLAQLAGAGVLLALSAAAVGRRSGRGVLVGMIALREPLLMAIGTRDSVACIPSVIDRMSGTLRISRRDLELVVPLGITLCRVGPVIYFAVSTLFIAQLYGVPLHLPQLALVVAGSVAAGLAASGASGLLAITLVGVVCGPLGLPIGAAMVLFLAVDPVIEVFRTVTNVFGSCALAAVLCAREEAVVNAVADAA